MNRVNQFSFSLIFSDYFQNFIFLSSNKYSTRKNLGQEIGDIYGMDVYNNILYRHDISMLFINFNYLLY